MILPKEREAAVQSLLARTANPEAPYETAVSQPSDVLTARAAAAGAFDSLFLGLGVVALIVGAVGVANIMIISVLERRRRSGCVAPSVRRWARSGRSSSPNRSCSRPSVASSASWREPRQRPSTPPRRTGGRHPSGGMVGRRRRGARHRRARRPHAGHSSVPDAAHRRVANGLRYGSGAG